MSPDPAMYRNKRPLSVTILGCVYIGVGAVGFVAHFNSLLARDPFHSDGISIEVTELLALVAGIFLLRAQNWARWLSLGWIGFHVILSAFHTFAELAMHAAFFAITGWVLFRPEAARFFRGARLEQP